MGQIFNDALTSFVKGEISFTDDTIKCALYTAAPDIDADTFLSDITGEASGTGYTSGGATLASKTVTTDDTNNRTVADAADVQWTITGSLTYRYVVVYQSTGNSATSRLIAFHDYGSNQTIDASTLTVEWPSTGVFYFQNP